MRAVGPGVLRVILGVSMLSCGGASPAPAPPPPAANTPEPTPTSATPAVATPTSAPSDDWRCGGDLVPPTGWEQQTSFEDSRTPNATQVASDRATRELTQRLCGGASDCDFLRARVSPWKTGSNGTQVCAMSVVKKEDLEDWRGRTLTLTNLDTALGTASTELLKPLTAGKTRVTVAEVTDLGVPGGMRADWLRARLSRLLEKGASVVDPPRGWAGNGTPSGIDLVVRGSIVSRGEGGIPMLEVTWDGMTSRGSHVHATPISFPQSASPPAPAAALVTLPQSEGLSVRIDSARAGGLCAGERTQLWVESDRDAFVRVFDLYGDNQVLLEYPDDDSPSAKLPAGQTVAVGGKLGFEAVPVPGYEYERFLVVAAPSEAALGPMRAIKGPCRIDADVARQLHAGGGTPAGTKVARTGYRIFTDPACAASAPTVQARQGVVDSIAALPVCRPR
jgi:hypothetical protein